MVDDKATVSPFYRTSAQHALQLEVDAVDFKQEQQRLAEVHRSALGGGHQGEAAVGKDD